MIQTYKDIIGMQNLHNLILDWEEWSQTADKSENGWQSDFPEWEILIETTKQLMLKNELKEDRISHIEKVWKFSEEDEELKDFAEQNINRLSPLLIKLSKSKFAETRWQVYGLMPHLGMIGEKILRTGLDDLDGYCKRIALLNLAKLKPIDSKDIALRFINSDDPYLRLANIEMIRITDDKEFIKTSKDQLIKDEKEYVRNAAVRYL